MASSKRQLTSQQKKRAREVALVKRSLAVTSLYMLAELVIGYQFNVLSLVADSYHMMNDMAAFIVQLYANEIGELDRPHSKSTTAFSYGFSRVEFLANLIQGTLLLALCLTLALESLQRLYSPETITLPPAATAMGVLGLIWNLVMFRLFEGNHGHKEEEEAHELAHPLRYRERLMSAAVNAPSRLARSGRSRSVSMHALGHGHTAPHAPPSRLKRAFSPENSLAIHALGDAAGNVAVILDGVASWLFGAQHGRISGVIKPWNGVVYVDPLCSLVVVYVILIHAFPLVTKSSFALMHAFDPVKNSEIKRIFHEGHWLPHSLAELAEVQLRDLHIWSLSESSRFATVSLVVYPLHGAHSLAADHFVEIEQAAKRVLEKVAPPTQVTVEVDLGHPIPPGRPQPRDLPQ
ncbi:hypothetical protein JCM8097_002653 [Rhodosporidiobolus ruineniae]